MKAVRYAEYGGPEVLTLVEADEPHAGPGRIRIAVRAAGVNSIDWKLRSGMLSGGKPLASPRGTGIDAAGVVDEIGDGVTGVAIGDAVFGNGSATFAEFAVLSSWAIKPQSLSYEEAAGYPGATETAIRILDQVGVQPGQALLVSGAAGGVGSAVLQIAADRGIHVIGTASAKNQDYLRSLGAVATTYGPGLVDRVREIAPDGIDAALDIAGSGVIPELITVTGDPGKVLSIADFSAPELGALVSSQVSDMPGALAEAARLHSLGRYTLPVAETFPLSAAAAAQTASARGHVVGKYVVVVASS